MGVRHTETNLIIWSAPMADQPTPTTVTTLASSAPLFGADYFYDAGDQGCAFGPLDEIARLMRRLTPGQTLEVHATDPTVAIDLSAWCRMTGHSLVEQQGACYLLRRKTE